MEEVNKAFTCYPNPTSDFIKLEGLEALTAVQLYNLSGEQVLSCKASILGDLKLDLRHLERGVYLLKVGKVTKKIYLRN